MLGSNEPGPTDLSIARSPLTGRPRLLGAAAHTQDGTGIERREARVTSVCALAIEANWHGAGLTECNTRQLADSAEAVHAAEVE